MDAIAAEQFLIAKVTEEARWEGVSLSEIERRCCNSQRCILLSPISTKSLRNLKKTCDTDEYELKIVSLLRNARARDNKLPTDRDQDWKDALGALKNEDHYILVMTTRAFSRNSASSLGLNIRHLLLYLAVGIAVLLILFIVTLWRWAPLAMIG